MWQFAMNFPADKEDCGADFAGRGGGDRLPALVCFTALAVLHAVFFSVFGFFAQNERPVTETAELFLTLDFPEIGLQPVPLAVDEPAGAPPEIPLPLPPEEILPPEPVPTELLPSPEESAAAPQLEEAVEAAVPVAVPLSLPQTGGVLTNGAHTGGSAQAGMRTMTEAEYLALIMGQLEKNKIYPLAARKRGVEGDITVRFTIRQRDGSVSDIQLADTSGHRFLTQAAIETIRSASPFPVMEGREADYTARVSIRYRLEDQAN
ncbi:MAG: energy transducer TonB [Spirochaetaceae bacterium]|jgi:protein TonB|nr:energy transducer TonB [Spirochaetaceae bacterium]